VCEKRQSKKIQNARSKSEANKKAIKLTPIQEEGAAAGGAAGRAPCRKRNDKRILSAECIKRRYIFRCPVFVAAASDSQRFKCLGD